MGQNKGFFSHSITLSALNSRIFFMTETEYSILYWWGAGQGSDFEDGVSRLCPNF